MLPSPLLVYCSFPDEETARKVAMKLIEGRLAACVNLSSGQSIYRWRDQIESATETTAQIKTSSQHFPALQACILHHHPYEVPEIIGIPITEISPSYRDWLITNLANDQ